MELPGPLVSPEWLAAHLGEPGLVVADVRWVREGSAREAFEAGHIAGAVFLDADDDLSAIGQGSGRHPLPSPEAVRARHVARGDRRRHGRGGLRRRLGLDRRAPVVDARRDRARRGAPGRRAGGVDRTTRHRSGAGRAGGNRLHASSVAAGADGGGRRRERRARRPSLRGPGRAAGGAIPRRGRADRSGGGSHPRGSLGAVGRQRGPIHRSLPPERSAPRTLRGARRPQGRRRHRLLRLRGHGDPRPPRHATRRLPTRRKALRRLVVRVDRGSGSTGRDRRRAG